MSPNITQMTAKQETDPLVSVIIPCYNSETTIRDCLDAIMSQRTSVRFDVIVVDSSSDRTAEIVQREYTSVKLIRREERTFAGIARNLGIRSTRASYCLMLDSDCIAPPDLIDRMVARHAGDNLAAVSGSLRNGTPGSLSGTVGYLIEFKEFMPTAPMRLERLAPTANIAYRREIFDSYGYFDPEMRLSEDILFNWKITSMGERILFDPSISVTHLNRTGWRTVLGYQVSLGRMSALARKRGGLPGQLAVRYPALICLMPLFRLARAAMWFGRHDKKTMLLFILIWPFYLAAALFWAWGFLAGALNKR